MKQGHSFSQSILWVSMIIVVFGMVAIGTMTNITLRSIEKNLPKTLFTEINDLSAILEDLSEIVTAAEIAHIRMTPQNFDHLKSRVDVVYAEIIQLRESYVYDNLVKASAFHAVVAPAITDLQAWTQEGISGFGPRAPQTMEIILYRIRDAYSKARSLTRESRDNARMILEKQRTRLDRFLFSVNLFFGLAVMITLCMVYLLTRQYILQKRERIVQSELREQRDLLNSLFENIPMGITVWDRDGRLLLSNKGFEEITGSSGETDQTLAKWFETGFPDPKDREKAEARMAMPVELRLHCRKGEIKPIEMTRALLQDGRILVTLSDISDRIETRRMRRESQEIKERSRKMDSLGLLAGGVAHDLNNILSGVINYPELMLMDLPEKSPLKKPLKTIQSSGERAVAIVMDLLTVARGVATVKDPMDLNTLIRDYLDSPEFEKLTQFHETVRIKCELANNLLHITGSTIHIRKVVMNLVANAAEAVGENGRVTISTSNCYVDKPFRGYDDFREGEYVVLSVSDNGPGISAEDRERIFEPFYTKKVMGRSGTGLGLSVVWNIVQDHKGHIDLACGQGGTSFNLYFPATREDISLQKPHKPLAAYQGKGEKILVVDDVDTQREITFNMLEKLNYSAATVPSGEEAVAYLKKHDADLVVLDMIMDPGINGRETFERILRFRPGQKAIITSGFAETDEVRKAQELGAGKYIKKPFTLEILGLAVKESLDNT